MKRFLAFIYSVSLIVALLFLSAELLLYGSLKWYEHEYKKYDVEQHMIKKISMQSLLEVTDEMMDYLRGGRDDLVVYAKRDGKSQEFFTDREKAHMADVRKLFIGGIIISRVCLVVCVIMLILIYFRRRGELNDQKTAANRVLASAAPDHLPPPPDPISVTISRWFIFTSVLMIGGAAFVAVKLSQNFDKYFVAFHHVFFNNDLWLLDPAKDDMINMLPEGFFSDTAGAVIAIFTIALVILILIAIGILKRYKRKRASA